MRGCEAGTRATASRVAEEGSPAFSCTLRFLALPLMIACGGNALHSVGRDAAPSTTGVASGGAGGASGAGGGAGSFSGGTTGMVSAGGTGLATGGQVSQGGSGGADGDVAVSDDLPVADAGCGFGMLWDVVVEAAGVIGSCYPVATCTLDADGGSPDGAAALGPCSEIGNHGDGGVAIVDGFVDVPDWGIHTYDSAVVIDSEGRVIDLYGQVRGGKQRWLDSLADCRFPELAGQSIHYWCFSE
jgi:hypothetical protein